MESLISLDGFADVANNLIDRLSNAVGWVATHKTPTKIAIDTYIEDIQNSNYDPVTKAALISKAKKTVKEYCNQYDIVNKALEMITPTAEPEKIDSDWLAQFMDKTRLVSDLEFQIIWANILAEECNAPGTIPKGLLHTVEQMDKNAALVFMKLAKISVKYVDEGKTEYCPIVFYNDFSDYYKSIGVILDDLIELQSLGLINMCDFDTYFKKCAGPVDIYYNEQKYHSEAYFPVGKAVYTRIGDALCGAVHPEKVDDFFEKICVPAWDKYKEKSEKDSFLI